MISLIVFILVRVCVVYFFFLNSICLGVFFLLFHVFPSRTCFNVTVYLMLGKEGKREGWLELVCGV